MNDTLHSSNLNSLQNLHFRCLCAEDAEVAWSIDGKEINEDDEQYATSSCDGEQLLEIVQPLVSDTATFSCRSHIDKITSHL